MLKKIVIFVSLTFFNFHLRADFYQNNFQKYFNDKQVSAELYKENGEVVKLESNSVNRDSIILLFNHGTNNLFFSQKCVPSANPKIFPLLTSLPINNKEVTAFHLCSYSNARSSEELTFIRATEIFYSVKYFLDLGIPAKNIFVFGHSRGGWSTLFFASQNKVPDLGGYITFAPAVCGPRPLRCMETIAKDIEFFKSSQINGFLFSNIKDPFFRPEEHSFAAQVQGLNLVSDFCNALDERRAHNFFREECSTVIFDQVKSFIQMRSQ